MPGGTVDRRVIAVAVAIPAIILGVVLFAQATGGDDDESVTVDPSTTVSTDTTGTASPVAVDRAWDDALADALEPLGRAIPDLADAVTGWEAGDRSDADLRAELDRLGPMFGAVEHATQRLPAHPGDRLATPLIRSMARLYVLSVDAHELSLAVADHAAATQYGRLGRRLRILGDRVFDRARERTAAPFDPGDAVDLHLPAEVPDWTRLGLAVGPPLVPADTNVDDEPLEREDERASLPESEWRDAVEELDAPTAEAVAAALDAGEVDQLGRLAGRLIDAAESLRVVPVPEGDRGRADRLGLAWLLRADVARAGQLAMLGDAGGDGEAMALAGAVLEVAETGALTGG